MLPVASHHLQPAPQRHPTYTIFPWLQIHIPLYDPPFTLTQENLQNNILLYVFPENQKNHQPFIFYFPISFRTVDLLQGPMDSEA